MTTDTIREAEKHVEENSANVSTSTPATLVSIVASIRTDCQQNAKAYLEETKVPHGGE